MTFTRALSILLAMAFLMEVAIIANACRNEYLSLLRVEEMQGTLDAREVSFKCIPQKIGEVVVLCPGAQR